jgi:lipoate-protein ligase A
MPIALIDYTAATLNENLALDEALLLAAEAGTGGEVLRFSEWPELAVVLGAGGSIAIDVNEDACRAAGVSMHRRASGGGTVLLGRGCLLFSLILSFDRAAELRDVNASYRWILGRVRDALRPIVPLEAAGISDLAWDGRKVSGNAQHRKARHVLQHGTLLYSFDLAAIGRFLKPPEREPAYRVSRDHDAFVTNLPIGVDALKRYLAAAFDAAPGALSPSAIDLVAGLVNAKYETGEWVRRR